MSGIKILSLSRWHCNSFLIGLSNSSFIALAHDNHCSESDLTFRNSSLEMRRVRKQKCKRINCNFLCDRDCWIFPSKKSAFTISSAIAVDLPSQTMMTRFFRQFFLNVIPRIFYFHVLQKNEKAFFSVLVKRGRLKRPAEWTKCYFVFVARICAWQKNVQNTFCHKQ